MIEPIWPAAMGMAAQPLDPALVAEIDDASLRGALAAASLTDRIVLVAELLHRGVRLAPPV